MIRSVIMFAFIVSLAFLMWLVCARDASAQDAARVATQFCSPWSQLRAELKKRWTEEPIGGGQVSVAVAVGILAAPDGATFTIVVRHASGVACIIAAGKDFEMAPPPVKPDREG